MMKIHELIPDLVATEILRLVKIDRHWVETERLGGTSFRMRPKHPTWLRMVSKAAADYAAMMAQSWWLADGPKVFKPSPEQCQVLEQVEVRLEIQDYVQPFPAIYVEAPYPPFSGAICAHSPNMLICNLLSPPAHADDITTIISDASPNIETSINSYHDDCKQYAPQSSRLLRVAINSCLALAHWGCHYDYLFKKDAASDQRLARERTARGERARKRLALAVQKLEFNQEVVLHRVVTRPRVPGEPTGVTRPPHWRRGHWAMQVHGQRRSLRKRIFRQAVLVRQDLFVGRRENTQTTYTG